MGFTTPCTTVNIPYTENFASPTVPALPACMTQVQGNPSDKPWETSNTAAAGMTVPTARIAYTLSGSPNMNSWLFTAGLNLTGGVSYRLRYKYGSGSSTSYFESLSVSYGTANTTAAMTNPLADHPSFRTTTAVNNTVDFTPSATGVYYIGFKCYSIANQLAVVLDDISVTLTPSCESPTALSVDSIASDGAGFSWTGSTSAPANGYQWEVRDAADAVVASGSTAAGDTLAAATGLSAETDYSLYVRSDCGDGLSPWAGPVNFYTGYCIAEGNNTTYYINDFSTSNSLGNISNAGTGYATNGYGDYSAMAVSDTSGATFDFNAVFGSGSNTFHFRIWVDWNNDLQFDDVDELMFDGTAYQTSYTGGVTIPAGTALGSYRMRIRNTFTGTPSPCGTSNGETEDYTIQVIAPPSCLPPTNLSASNVGVNSADLVWSPSTSNPADGYQWEVRDEASTIAASGSTLAGVTTASATGLVDNTAYDLYVRAICGAEDTSMWAGPMGFTTSCASVATFSEDFDGVATPGFPACWAKVGTTGSASTQTSNPSSAPNTMYIYASTTSSLPVVRMQSVSNLGSGTHRFRFNMRANFTVGGIIEIGYLTDPDNDATFTSLGSVTAAALTYSEYIFAPPAGSYSNHPAFRHTGAPANSVLIDDVRWEAIPTCEAPTALSVDSVAADGEGFSWTGSTSAPANGYQWEVRDAGDVVVASGTTAAGDTIAEASGLTPETNYSLYVRSDCDGTLSTWAGPEAFYTGYCLVTNGTATYGIGQFQTNGGSTNIM
ncbi:MAG TPA: fibronectin type III domain-containing protein, partial [Flavobacteriales bacterium]|nr:fibronectin type III domain-containing protein [Flavobacteriales bacterium]